MELIPNYELSGSTNDGNTVTAVRVDSSTKIRLDAQYSRKYSSYNQNTGIYSVPTVGFVVRRDIANAEGNPVGQRVTGSLDIRLPVAAAEADLDALIADLKSYINDPGLKNNITKQLLPTCCASVAE